jgi:hypothetical protein
LSPSADDCIQTSVGDLFEALKPLPADTNRNLAAQAIRLCARLANAMGQPFGSSGRIVVAPILKVVGDAKPVVRSAVSEFITAYVTSCGWNALEDKMAAMLDKPACVGVGKSTVLDCYAALVAGAAAPLTAHEVLVVVQACGHGLIDKAMEPRMKATALLKTLLEGPTPQYMAPAAAKLPDKQAALVNDVLAKEGIAAAPAAATSPPGQRPCTAGRRPPAGGAPRAGAVSASINGTACGAAAPAARARPVSRNGAAGSRPTSAASSMMPDDSGPLVAMVNPREKDKRIVPLRSFKFEPRVGEAVELKRELSPHVSPMLAALLFSKDWQNHCKAAEKLEVRTSACTAQKLTVMCLPSMPKV